MKKLTDAIAWVFAGFIAAITALITFIFREKKDINKHMKLVDLEKKRNMQNSVDKDTQDELVYFLSKYSVLLHGPQSKRKIEKLKTKAVFETITVKTDYTYDILKEILSKYGQCLEYNEEKHISGYVIYLDKRKKHPLLFISNISNTEMKMAVVCIKGFQRRAKSALKRISKEYKKLEGKKKRGRFFSRKIIG